MLKKYHWMVTTAILLFSVNLYAFSCTSNADCNSWEASNCACGVQATCQGITQDSPSGNCQCYGAQGSCSQNTQETAEPQAVPRAATPYRRGHGAARRGVRRNNSNVQSVEIDR